VDTPSLVTPTLHTQLAASIFNPLSSVPPPSSHPSCPPPLLTPQPSSPLFHPPLPHLRSSQPRGFNFRVPSHGYFLLNDAVRQLFLHLTTGLAYPRLIYSLISKNGFRLSGRWYDIFLVGPPPQASSRCPSQFPQCDLRRAGGQEAVSLTDEDFPLPRMIFPGERTL